MLHLTFSVEAQYLPCPLFINIWTKPRLITNCDYHPTVDSSLPNPSVFRSFPEQFILTRKNINWGLFYTKLASKTNTLPITKQETKEQGQLLLSFQKSTSWDWLLSFSCCFLTFTVAHVLHKPHAIWLAQEERITQKESKIPSIKIDPRMTDDRISR